MTREEFIGKLQMVYVGDRNAFNEIVGVFDELQNKINDTTKYLKKEKNNYLTSGCKIADTNAANIIVSAAVNTCDCSIDMLGSDKN